MAGLRRVACGMRGSWVDCWLAFRRHLALVDSNCHPAVKLVSRLVALGMLS